MDYLPLQKHTMCSCCSLYAIYNALRWFGKSTIIPGTPEWEKMVDFAKCRYGSALGVENVGKHLGLTMVRHDYDFVRAKHLTLQESLGVIKYPAILAMDNPEKTGSAIHAVFAPDSNTLVNYFWVSGPLIHVPTLAVKKKLEIWWWHDCQLQEK